MIDEILADIIVTLHFIWVLFMLAGFILTAGGFWWRKFFDRWLFRTLHAAGIFFVTILTALKQYCPLTVWENTLRAKYDPSLVYADSCIAHYVQKLLYPEFNPLIIRGVTIFIAIFTIVVFIIRPPAKIKKIFKNQSKNLFKNFKNWV